MWLIKTAAGKKSYGIGDVVKEKATERSGIILNHYMGRYIVEFETVSDNPFKRETKSFTDEEMSKNFTKGKPLAKKAAEDSVLDDAIVSVLIEQFKTGPQEEESAIEADKEATAAAFEDAANSIMDKAIETFGEEFSTHMTLSTLANRLTAHMSGPEKAQKIEEIREQAAVAMDDIAAQLKSKFPSLAGHINAIAGIDIYTEDPKSMEPVAAHYATPNFGELYKFFLDAQLKAQELPPEILREKLREYGGIVGPRRMRTQVKEVLEKEEEEKLGEGYSQRLPELLQELTTTMPAVPAPVKASKRAMYDIEVGDKVIDASYGVGFVTSTATLDDGFVSVQFGDNVKISAYAADKIATPYQAPIDEFQCPMDQSLITAESCFGEFPERACSFLKYIDEVPTCTYRMEMKASDDNKAALKQKIADKTTAQTNKITEIKKQLEEVLRAAQFDDHDVFTFEKTHVPILVTSFVKKRKSDIYGRVIESSLDDSVTVKWTDGTKSVAWKVELDGITKKAFLDFVISKLMKEARGKVEDIAKKKADGTLTGDQFISALESLKSELNITGIGEADFREQYWEAVRRLGLPELAPAPQEQPVYELPDETLLQDVQTQYGGDTTLSPASASLKVEADEKLDKELTKQVNQYSQSVPYVATNNPKDPAAANMSIDVVIKDWSWVKEKDGQYVKLDKDNLLITKPDGTALTEAEWETFIVPNRKNISALLTPPPEENPAVPSREPVALAASKE